MNSPKPNIALLACLFVLGIGSLVRFSQHLFQVPKM
jgi:hypothetical protein